MFKIFHRRSTVKQQMPINPISINPLPSLSEEEKEIKGLEKELSKINPKTCPHEEGYEGPSGGVATNCICSRCGAYINWTPFGKDLIGEDARITATFSVNNLKVERWDLEKKIDMIKNPAKYLVENI